MDHEYSLSWILPFVRESLRDRSNFSYLQYADGLWCALEGKEPGIVRNPPTRGYTGASFDFSQADHRLRVAAAEAFYYLIRAGLVVPNPPCSRADLSLGNAEYYKTSLGAEWAAGQEPVPEDSAGYLRIVRGLVSGLDLVIEQYISEGLSSFIRRNYFAGAVMIGAASEKALYLLAESMVVALKTSHQQNELKNLLTTRRLEKLLGFIATKIQESETRGILPYSVAQGSSRHLMSLFESIRVQRNDAVHPMNAQVSADSVRHSYTAFPHALEKLEVIRNWLLAHPGSI